MNVSSATVAGLPLRYRLPNPPPVYEGRSAEERWLRERLGKGPLAVVLGAGGIGKTSLVLHALSGSGDGTDPAAGTRTLYVDVRPADPPEDVRLEVARALVAGQAVESIEWSSLSADPEALGAVIVDLADTGRWLVVLDDVQNAAPESVRELVGQIDRYARASRFVLIARELPKALELGDRLLSLGAMREGDLTRLARACAPERDAGAIDEATRLARGSPLRLLQILAAPPSGEPGSAAAAVEELPPDLRRALLQLSILQVPIRATLLARFVEGADDDAIGALEQRGLLDRTGNTLRVHDVVRDDLAAPPRDEFVRWAQNAAPLLADEDPPTALEALRLFLAAGDQEGARALLSRRGEELLAAGYAHRLWRLVGASGGATQDPALARFSLRCAVELGDPEILQNVSEPEEPDAAARLLWARALFAQGRLDEAARAGKEASEAARAENDDDAAFEAGFLHARSLANLSRWDESIAAFDALDPGKVDDRARRDVVVARCMVLRGDATPALDRIRDVRPRIDELSPQVRIELCYALGDLLHELGRTDEAMELLERVDRDERGASPLLYSQWGRRALYQRATLALSRGALDEARETLSSLWPFMGPASLLRPHLVLADAIVRFAAGELAGVDEAFADVREEGRRRASDGLYSVAEVYLRRARMLRAEPIDEAPEQSLLLSPETLFGGLFALYGMQARLRRGDVVSADELAPYLDRADLPELRVASHIVACERELLHGDPIEALRAAEIATDEARGGRLGVALAEASVARCAALSILDRRAELEEAASDLDEQAEEMPSSRFEVEARFFRLTAAGASAGLARMADVAARAATSPAAARRAAAALGSKPALEALDALDRAIVSAMRERDPWSRLDRIDREGDPSDWRHAWGMDAGQRAVWLPGNERVDLSGKPLLWRLLTVLADHGGAATKEELVLEAWDVREYHPLRHDNRLQVAMRKLRRAIEIDPSRPERVVTTDDGYALAGPVIFERPPPRLSDLPPRPR